MRSSFLPVLILAWWSFVLPSRAAIDESLNRAIWKMAWRVSEAQATDAIWLAADADADGQSSGAELAAGTDPFNAASHLRITALSNLGANLALTFPTMRGKQYGAQSSPNLTAPEWAELSPSVSVIGDGTPMSLSVPKLSSGFYRVLVRDIDTDGDDVSDWAEAIAGYDLASAKTKGSLTDDHTALLAAVASSNVITIVVGDSSATQPPDALTAVVDAGRLSVRRSGPLLFSTVTVPLQKAGTALEGTDYDALPASVTFAADEAEVVFNINPVANPSRNTNVTAILKAMPGVGYTVGAPSGGSVVIQPAGTANGTGLTGRYHHTSSATYSAQQAIFAGSAEMTRVDGQIAFNAIASISPGNPCTITMLKPHGLTTGNSVSFNGVSGGTFNPTIIGTFAATVTGPTTFTVPSNCTTAPISVVSASVAGVNGPNGWGSIEGPAGMTPPSTNRAFSVAWTGQLLPKYSETYIIDMRSDESVKVWVGGKLLINRWTPQGPADWVNTIDLKAGVLYDIRIEYWSNANSTTPVAMLYWFSPSQVRQIIPQDRLFPEPAQSSKPTAILSSLDAVGYVGVPFAYSVATPGIGGAVTYSLDLDSGSLPPGLALDRVTGEIAGTPTVAGSFNVAVNAQNSAAGASTGSSVVNFRIFPAGGVTREVLAATGSSVASIVLPASNPGGTTIATADDDTDHAPNTGMRLRGYFVPPKTGNYYFWLAANNAAELWISDNAEFVNKARRATVSAPGSGRKQWNAQSPWLSFVAGERYYFEVLHNTGADADDHVAVGWCQDELGALPAVAGVPNPTGTPPSLPDGDGPLQGYPLSGLMPGYVFQPYDYPAAIAATGTLYACNLGPQGGAATTASGSASLRVNATGTQAVLKFAFQGLGSPKTAYHLHVDAFDDHSKGEIVFDLDDIDAFHPELRTADGGYIWTLAPSGTFPSAASLVDAIQRGKVYLNIHTVLYPEGEMRGTFSRVDGSQTAPDPAGYGDPGYPTDHTTDAGAARFFNQATFGASPADIAAVKTNGFAASIAGQLTQPASTTTAETLATLTAEITNLYGSNQFVNVWWKNAITAPDQLRQRLAFALSEILVVSFQDDTGPLARNSRLLAHYYDTLLTYALPTAGVPESGSFRGLLKAVTLTPGMGLYLDMRGNQKGDLALGRHPNENYAREILQLFSTGLYRMWDDGTLVLDSAANPIATCSQAEILGFSATLTGWNFNQALQAGGRLPVSFSVPGDYLNPMLLVSRFHERGSKLLLNRMNLPAATGQTPRVDVASVSIGTPATIHSATGHGLKVGDTVTVAGVSGGTFSAQINATHRITQVVDADSFRVAVDCSTAPTNNTGTVTGTTVLGGAFNLSGIPPIPGSQSDDTGTIAPHPYDQYGLGELDQVIDNIAQHDNVGPFLCRQLIQRLVTSDPAPGYLYRVVQKFRDNGAGVRGDLAAVVTQILLDGEARNSVAARANPFFGKQREPLLRVTGPARAFPPTSYTGTYTQLGGVDSHRLRITTSTPHKLSANFNVALDFRDNYAPPGQTLTPSDNPTTAPYGILAIGANTLDVAATGMSNVTYSQSAGSNVLTVNLGGPPTDARVLGNQATVPISVVAATNPCRLTSTGHGLSTGQVVEIGGITNGSFSPAINGLHTVTVLDANNFTVPVACSTAPTVTGSFTRTVKSRVYLHFLTQTGVGGAVLPASQVYEVQANATATTFTVRTADTPATARGGNVIVPRIGGSYTIATPTQVRFNFEANHNLQTGGTLWIDTRVQNGAPVDGEYTIGSVSDWNHVTVSYPPTYPAALGTYANPTGNGETNFWPLVPPVLSRSGTVKVNVSTYQCDSTENLLSQTPLNAPTVFNFFFPDYKFPGSLAANQIDSPEFQLTNDSDIVKLTNTVTNMFIGSGGGNSNLNGLGSFSGGAVVFDLGEFMTPALTADAGVPNLIDAIADRLVGGPLSAGVKAQIQSLVGNTSYFPLSSPAPTNQQMRDRVRAAVHLITATAEYAIQR